MALQQNESRLGLAAIAVLFAMTTTTLAETAETLRARIELDQRMARGEYQNDLIQPDSFDNMKLLIPQLLSVVRGEVTDISYDYLDCQGPRTVITLKRVETLLGAEGDGEIQLRTFGGPLPNGTYAEASELPHFVEGATYVLFLRNTDWRFSPVMGDLAFREETLFDRKVLIDSDGFAVTGISETGVDRNSDQITEAAGRTIMGISSNREIESQSGNGGEARACESGELCNAQKESGEKDSAALSAIKDPTNRFARPEISKGVGPESLRLAISTDRFIERLKGVVFETGFNEGRKFQPEPRLGCWNLTITDPWR